METGMLWFDNKQGKTLAERVEEAAQYYQRKYGRRPTKAFAPAGTKDTTVNGIRVEGDRSVLENHLWIGVE